MNKQTAIANLGGTPKSAQLAMKYKTIQAIYMWPKILPRRVSDLVLVAMARLALETKGSPLVSEIARVINVYE